MYYPSNCHTVKEARGKSNASKWDRSSRKSIRYPTYLHFRFTYLSNTRTTDRATHRHREPATKLLAIGQPGVFCTEALVQPFDINRRPQETVVQYLCMDYVCPVILVSTFLDFWRCLQNRDVHTFNSNLQCLH